MPQILALLGMIGSLKDALAGLVDTVKEVGAKVADTAMFGYGAETIKPLQGMAQGIEQIKLLRDNNVSLGSQYMTPFGTAAYWNKVAKNVKDTNKEIGIGGQLTDNFLKTIEKATDKTLELGYNQETVTKSLQQFFQNNSRNRIFDEEDIVNISKIRGSLGDGFEDIFAYRQMVGGSIKETFTFLDKVVERTDRYGVNAKKVLANIQQNLNLLNTYKFTNGIKGLEEMARNAERFGASMTTAAGLAEKVMTPEGALEVAAELQMLGGEFAKFGDFQNLIYSARNGVEGLQTGLIGATKGMASFNLETGNFDINALNFSKLRQASQIIGAPLEELSKAAINNAKAEEVKRRINVKNFVNSDEAISKIAGAAEFKSGGVATIKVVGGDGKTLEKSLFEVTQSDLDKLSIKTDKLNPKDNFEQLIQSNMSLGENLQRLGSILERKMNPFEAYQTQANDLTKLTEKLIGDVNDPKSFIGKMSTAIQALQTNMSESFSNVINSKTFTDALGNMKENLDPLSYSNKKMLSTITDDVFEGNAAAKGIIMGTATITSSVVNLTGDLLSGGFNPSDPFGTYNPQKIAEKALQALEEEKRKKAEAEAKNKKADGTYTPIILEDRREMLNRFKPVEADSILENKDGTLTFGGELIIKLESDQNISMSTQDVKNLEKSLSKKILDELEGKYDMSGGGRSSGRRNSKNPTMS